MAARAAGKGMKKNQDSSASGEVRRVNTLTGIVLKVLSVAIFVGMSTFIKLAGLLPAGEIVFFRSFFAIFPILALFAWRGELRSALSTSRPLSHVMRGAVGVSAMALGFFALTRLPLPEAIALNYAQPLLVVVFSAIFLRETIRVYRWSAVAVGLIGVLIISWPKLTLFTSEAGMSNQEAVGVAAALISASLSAVALLLVRRLVQTERSATIVLWFSLSASCAALISIPFGWETLSYGQAGWLVSAGICGGVAQIFMTESYRHAEASTVAPFEYTSMLLGVGVGYFVFSEIPTIHTLIGAAIVISAGIFIIWRERRLGIQRARVKATVPTQ